MIDKRYILLLLLVILGLIGLLAHSKQAHNTTRFSTIGKDERHDDKINGPATIRYAKGLTIEYRQGYKILRVLSPWQNAHATFTYVLVPRGMPIPPIHEANVTVVVTPVRRAVIDSQMYVPFFSMLHLNDRIVAISECAIISTPSVAELIRAGRIAEVAIGSGMARLINLERLYSLQPDLILTHGSSNPNYDRHGKLMEAGFHVAIDGGSMETTPLGRMEWIKFIAAFFDKDAEAERLFDEIAHRYEAVGCEDAHGQCTPDRLLRYDVPGHLVYAWRRQLCRGVSARCRSELSVARRSYHREYVTRHRSRDRAGKKRRHLVAPVSAAR